MKSINYLIMASIILIVFTAGYVIVETIIEVYTLGNRVEDSIIAAGWTGLSRVDLDRLAQRVHQDNEQERDIYLDKPAAISLVTTYIKRNLNLDAAFYPQEDSYVLERSVPVIINEITVFNADELPATCSRGVTLERTTIHVVVSIPIRLKWLGLRYIEKHVDVDMKSFYR